MSYKVPTNEVVSKRHQEIATEVRALLESGKTMKEIAEKMNYSDGFLYIVHRHFYGELRGRKGKLKAEQLTLAVKPEETMPSPVQEQPVIPEEMIVTEPSIAAFLFMQGIIALRMQEDRSSPGKIVFAYKNTPELREFVDEYFNNKRQVYPQEFSKATRHIFHSIKQFKMYNTGSSYAS